MEQELISKKDLLERYGISYGALYRWKRKGLIPEEWFIKKSTVTGQETFFPKELVCPRVEQIQSLKDECSLDDLAAQFVTAVQNAPTLILRTALGDKSFPLSQIHALLLDDGSGEPKDITNKIIEKEQ